MVRGMYIAGTGMILQRRAMETITNNIVNADTTGYKKETLTAHSFDAVMLRNVNSERQFSKSPTVGPLNYGTQVNELSIDYTTGNFEETGRSTDFALVGDAFFAIETPLGERYTSAGAFQVDVEGYLTDGEGNYLAGNDGRIFVGTTDFAVDTEGNVSVGGNVVGTIRVVSFEDNATLRKEGSNLFYSDAAPLANPNDFQVKQYFLESSNVDVGREMVNMISTYRTYETNQRMLTMIDETVGKAVNEIGRVR